MKMKILFAVILISMFAVSAFAQKNEGLYWIRENGKMIVEPKFKKATKFEGGAAQVETEDGMHHWIAADGRILWSQKPNETKGDKTKSDAMKNH